MQVYSIPRFDPDDSFAFLSLVARKIGKLKKGGVPDRVQAAKVVLRDWNTGRVRFFFLLFFFQRWRSLAASAFAAACAADVLHLLLVLLLRPSLVSREVLLTQAYTRKLKEYNSENYFLGVRSQFR